MKVLTRHRDDVRNYRQFLQGQILMGFFNNMFQSNKNYITSKLVFLNELIKGAKIMM